MTLLTTLVVTALLATGQAAPTPDFSGHWTLVPGTGHPATEITTRANTKIKREATGTYGREFTMTMTASTLTLVRASATAKITTVYRLDGVDTVNEEGPTQTRSKASWNGPKLTIQTWIASRGRPTGYPLTRVLWLEKGRLVVEERTTGNVPVVSKYVKSSK